MRRYDIWAEGFLDQGMEGIPAKARYVGFAYGDTFVQACENYYRENRSKEEFERYFRCYNGQPTYWVRLFDNEEDARKSFG